MKPGDELYVVADVKSPGLLIVPEAYPEFCQILAEGVSEDNLPRLKRMHQEKKIVLIIKSLKISISDFVPIRGMPGIDAVVQAGMLAGQSFVVPLFMVNDFTTRGDAERRITLARRKARHAQNVARAQANAVDLTSLIMRYASQNSVAIPDGREMVIRLTRGR